MLHAVRSQAGAQAGQHACRIVASYSAVGGTRRASRTARLQHRKRRGTNHHPRVAWQMAQFLKRGVQRGTRVGKQRRTDRLPSTPAQHRRGLAAAQPWGRVLQRPLSSPPGRAEQPRLDPLRLQRRAGVVAHPLSNPRLYRPPADAPAQRRVVVDLVGLPASLAAKTDTFLGESATGASSSAAASSRPCSPSPAPSW